MDSCKAALCGIVVCLGSGFGYADTNNSDAEQVAVTFFTEPANASLYSPTSGLYGAAPLTLYYPLPRIWDDCVQLEPLQAIWVSGVEADVRVRACPENSHAQHYTFMRPDVAGVDLDLWFAEKVGQLGMVNNPVSLSRNPAHAAKVEPLSGNLVTCADHGQNSSGCR